MSFLFFFPYIKTLVIKHKIRKLYEELCKVKKNAFSQVSILVPKLQIIFQKAIKKILLQEPYTYFKIFFVYH